MPISVMVVYAALVVWVICLGIGLRSGAWRPFLYFGLALMLYLNVGYVVYGVPESIAAFIGIYDVLINIGLVSAEGVAAVLPCPDNACTVWGETYTNHPGWGVAFYDRFANGPEFRSTLLYGHIIFNSIAFVLLHVQLARPGGRGTTHRLLGRVSFAALTVSLICAVWLASEHGSVVEYGGLWAECGFYSMAAVVYGCAIIGIVAIRGRDAARHRVWMFRFAGSMWGAFWLFRVVLFVIDPMLREFEALAILVVIWGSAPAGALIGDMVRRRLDRASWVRTSTVLAE